MTPSPATTPAPLVDTDPLVIERTAATDAQLARLEEATLLSYTFPSPYRLACIVALVRLAVKENMAGPLHGVYAETLADLEAVQARWVG